MPAASATPSASFDGYRAGYHHNLTPGGHERQLPQRGRAVRRWLQTQFAVSAHIYWCQMSKSTSSFLEPRDTSVILLSIAIVSFLDALLARFPSGCES